MYLRERIQLMFKLWITKLYFRTTRHWANVNFMRSIFLIPQTIEDLHLKSIVSQSILLNIVMITNLMTFKPISVSPYVLWLMSTYSYPKVKLSFITIALNKSSFVKHIKPWLQCVPYVPLVKLWKLKRLNCLSFN
jgi:hypothetical protein